MSPTPTSASAAPLVAPAADRRNTDVRAVTNARMPQASGTLPSPCTRTSAGAASVPAFTAQPSVVNGASELLGSVFGDAGAHARSAVGVPVLPLDSPVEVEVIFSYR